jgi:hypothetical protein
MDEKAKMLEKVLENIDSKVTGSEARTIKCST